MTLLSIVYFSFETFLPLLFLSLSVYILVR